MHQVENCRLDTYNCYFQVINPCIQARVQTLSGMEGSVMGKPFLAFAYHYIPGLALVSGTE